MRVPGAAEPPEPASHGGNLGCRGSFGPRLRSGAGDELRTQVPPPPTLQLLLFKLSLSAGQCTELPLRDCGDKGAARILRLASRSPVARVLRPLQELRDSLLLPLYPRPPALPPRASRVPSVLIGSLFLFCRQFREQLGRFAAVLSVPCHCALIPGGAYSSCHRAKGS